MGSALAFWAYQRNLGLNSEQHTQNDVQQNSSEKTQPTRTKRTESESSTVSWQTDPAVDRRGSAGDTTDDEALEHPQTKPNKPKGYRRFSLDFLFSRKSKDSKEKSKRSQSVAVPSEEYMEDHHIRAFRYPGITGSEFALAM